MKFDDLWQIILARGPKAVRASLETVCDIFYTKTGYFCFLFLKYTDHISSNKKEDT